MGSHCNFLQFCSTVDTGLGSGMLHILRWPHFHRTPLCKCIFSLPDSTRSSLYRTYPRRYRWGCRGARFCLQGTLLKPSTVILFVFLPYPLHFARYWRESRRKIHQVPCRKSLTICALGEQSRLQSRWKLCSRHTRQSLLWRSFWIEPLSPLFLPPAPTMSLAASSSSIFALNLQPWCC